MALLIPSRRKLHDGNQRRMEERISKTALVWVLDWHFLSIGNLHSHDQVSCKIPNNPPKKANSLLEYGTYKCE